MLRPPMSAAPQIPPLATVALRATAKFIISQLEPQQTCVINSDESRDVVLHRFLTELKPLQRLPAEILASVWALVAQSSPFVGFVGAALLPPPEQPDRGYMYSFWRAAAQHRQQDLIVCLAVQHRLLRYCIAKLPSHIRSAEFSGVTITDELFQLLANSPASATLMSLDISGGLITDLSIPLWKRFHSLQSLNINSCHLISASTLRAIGNLATLEAISCELLRGIDHSDILDTLFDYSLFPSIKRITRPLLDFTPETHARVEPEIRLVEWSILLQTLQKHPRQAFFEDLFAWTCPIPITFAEAPLVLQCHATCPALTRFLAGNLPVANLRLFEPFLPKFKSLTLSFPDATGSEEINDILANLSNQCQVLSELTLENITCRSRLELSQLTTVSSLTLEFRHSARALPLSVLRDWPPYLESLQIHSLASTLTNALDYDDDNDGNNTDTSSSSWEFQLEAREFISNLINSQLNPERLLRRLRINLDLPWPDDLLLLVFGAFPTLVDFSLGTKHQSLSASLGHLFQQKMTMMRSLPYVEHLEVKSLGLSNFDPRLFPNLHHLRLVNSDADDDNNDNRDSLLSILAQNLISLSLDQHGHHANKINMTSLLTYLTRLNRLELPFQIDAKLWVDFISKLRYLSHLKTNIPVSSSPFKRLHSAQLRRLELTADWAIPYPIHLHGNDFPNLEFIRLSHLPAHGTNPRVPVEVELASMPQLLQADLGSQISRPHEQLMVVKAINCPRMVDLCIIGLRLKQLVIEKCPSLARLQLIETVTDSRANCISIGGSNNIKFVFEGLGKRRFLSPDEDLSNLAVELYLPWLRPTIETLSL